jgi:hypothetical protein
MQGEMLLVVRRTAVASYDAPLLTKGAGWAAMQMVTVNMRAKRKRVVQARRR